MSQVHATDDDTNDMNILSHRNPPSASMKNAGYVMDETARLHLLNQLFVV